MSERSPDGKWLPGVAVSPETRFKKGRSGNPGGFLKRVRELRALALEESEASFRTIIAIRDDTAEKAQVRLEAAKTLLAYGMGAPPKVVEEQVADALDGMARLSVEELQALARQSLAEEATDDASDDDSDETEH